MSAGYEISRGQKEDIPALAKLLIYTWQQAYRDFLPLSFLEKMDVSRQEKRHQRYMDSGIRYWVVKDREGELCGFTSYGPNRFKQYFNVLELYTLYVAPAHQGNGLGTQLLEQVITENGERYDSIVVSVMSKNPYLGFYLKNDFAVIAEDEIDFGYFQVEGLILEREVRR
ncbi:MAG: GNAT family N-acetyltransferase [Saprospiraceae bacterium]|nr:GNAT family N-acetyltransferase [Lewinella sp.]